MNSEQNIAMIRRLIGQPLPNSPNDQILLGLLVNQLANFHTELANTQNHWSIGQFTLATSPNQEDYFVTATDFGRPFLVYTEDPNDQYHVRIEIPITLLQNADQRYFGPKTGFSVYPWSAAEIVFYREGAPSPNWKCRLIPIPTAAGQFTVFYETVYQYGSMSDRPGIEAFHHLVRTRTALSALPHCEWRGISPAKNPKVWQMKVTAMRDSLLHDEALYQRQFDQYRAQASREQVNNKLGFGWDYEQDFYPGGGGGRIIPGYGM